MGFHATGQAGTLRKGYQVAAQLGAWSLEDGGRVQATVQATAMWLDMPGPLDLWLQMGRKAWVWRGVDIEDRGQPFVIRVGGSPEVREAPATT